MSKSVRLMSDQQLDELLTEARHYNEKNQITGMLLYADGSFLQVIEGDEPILRKTFSSICADQRHKDIKTLFDETIDIRNFSEWSMGFRRLQNNNEVSQVPGMNQFLQANISLESYLYAQNNAAKLLKNIFTYFKRVA